MKKLECIMSILMVTFAIGFNLWLYRAEPTARIDPNDNSFQYGLIERTNEIWDWAETRCQQSTIQFSSFQFPFSIFCTLSYLTDHWVPNWAQGYNLPYYYSHIPQIAIVGTWRSIRSIPKISIFKSQFSKNVSNIENLILKIENLSLFTYYHLIIYLLLCFFPLSVFLSLRILKLPWLTAGIGALLSSHISTDGLYGMDPPSFIWRGWGLSSQLFAMIFMPLAIAYSIRYFSEIENSKHEARNPKQYQIEKEKNSKSFSFLIFNFSNLFRISNFEFRIYSSYLLSVLFITLTTMGHLGLGLMLFLAIPVIAFTRPIMSFLRQEPIKHMWREAKTAFLKTILLALPPILLLSYWIIPTLLGDVYHNVSFWDPIWKFNSYGAKEVLVNLWNGFLFDWGRLPIFTGLVFVGIAAVFINTNSMGDTSEGSCKLPESRNCNENPDKTVRNMSVVRRLARRVSGVRDEDVCGTRSWQDPCIYGYIAPLPFLFLFFLLLYFGSTTWGGILNLIPAMNQFHQHRFIVGLHLVALFLAPIGITYVAQSITNILHKFLILNFQFSNNFSNFKFQISNWLYLCIFIFLSLYLCYLIYPQTLSYGAYNQTLIEQANGNFLKVKSDTELLVTTLKSLMKDNPGRVFAGRGGSWGKNFQIAETAYFMYLSANGIPTVLWLPETWSNNSDTEQYFSEDVPDHYSLYNIRYVVAPPSQSPQPFWKLVKENPSWKLYGVQLQTSNLNNPISNFQYSISTFSYISAGSSPSIVFSDKLSFGNVIRLWIQSPYPGKGIFPELRLTGKKSASQGQAFGSYFSAIPNFAMVDEATYRTPDGKTHSLFAQPPQYMTPWEWPEAYPQIHLPSPSATYSGALAKNKKISNYINILSQSSDTDMVFRATVEVKEQCPTCVVVLKETYHPSWSAFIRKISDDERGEPVESTTVNGKKVKTINVFPSFVGVRLEEPGTYKVVFSYTPSKLKILLMIASGVLLIVAGVIFIKYRPQ